MRRGAAAIPVVAAALALPVTAPAASLDDRDGDTISHPANPDNYDVTGGTATHLSHGRLAHTVTVVGKPPLDSQLILIDVSPHTSRWCDYVIGHTDYGTGVFKCEYMDRVGSVKITRVGSDTIRYVFKRSAIGNPSRYGWAVLTRAPVDGSTIVDVDRAPDGPDTFVEYR